MSTRTPRAAGRSRPGSAPEDGKQAPPRREPFAAAGELRDAAAADAKARAALGVLPLATAAEVRTAYLKRALQAHPDKGGAVNEFRDVVAAFERLSRVPLSCAAGPSAATGRARSRSPRRRRPQKLFNARREDSRSRFCRWLHSFLLQLPPAKRRGIVEQRMDPSQRAELTKWMHVERLARERWRDRGAPPEDNGGPASKGYYYFYSNGGDKGLVQESCALGDCGPDPPESVALSHSELRSRPTRGIFQNRGLWVAQACLSWLVLQGPLRRDLAGALQDHVGIVYVRNAVQHDMATKTGDDAVVFEESLRKSLATAEAQCGLKLAELKGKVQFPANIWIGHSLLTAQVPWDQALADWVRIVAILPLRSASTGTGPFRRRLAPPELAALWQRLRAEYIDVVVAAGGLEAHTVDERLQRLEEQFRPRREKAELRWLAARRRALTMWAARQRAAHRRTAQRKPGQSDEDHVLENIELLLTDDLRRARDKEAG